MSKNPQVFYTSDLHIGHRLVAQDRGFVDFTQPAEMHPRLGRMVHPALPDLHDARLAEMWDSLVRPEDIVFVLGDVSINGSEAALEWVKARPGHKHLISGNHDPVHPHHRDSYKLYPRWMEVFDSIQPFLRRKLNGKYFLLSHFPYAGTGAEGHGVVDRYTQFRLPDMGMPLLHGHTHGKEWSHFSDEGSPELHIGLDAWANNLVPQSLVQEWLDDPQFLVR